MTIKLLKAFRSWIFSERGIDKVYSWKESNEAFKKFFALIDEEIAMEENRKKEETLLSDFTAYCKANPKERFWLALRNWSGVPFILASKHPVIEADVDTFYWEGKNEL